MHGSVEVCGVVSLPDPMAAIRYRQLFPEHDDVEARALLATFDLEHVDPGVNRPYTIANFIASVDGRVTVDGKSGALGDAGDKDVFRALRERVDAVLAGSTTMVTERYGRMLVDPVARERRAAAGLRPEPLAVLITRATALPESLPLLGEPEAEIVVFSPSAPDLSEVQAQVHHEAIPPGAEPLSYAMGVLRERYGVRTLLCEGGPSLFLSLLREGLIDELFLTVAPKLTGPAGHGGLIGEGHPLPDIAPLQLRTAIEREGTLFLRYSVG